MEPVYIATEKDCGRYHQGVVFVRLDTRRTNPGHFVKVGDFKSNYILELSCYFSRSEYVTIVIVMLVCFVRHVYLLFLAERFCLILINKDSMTVTVFVLVGYLFCTFFG